MIMLVWTILITVYSDSGSVPLYWGFYFGDSDIKRKRYCLMCNVFKPDRCHHCSVCNKCILNMDHHCPWINNCIGFFNRKFFIQMLFYINVTLIFINITNGKFVYDIIRKMINNRINVKKDLTENIYFLVLYFMDFLLMFFLGSFFKFHLKLVLENKTTIETIDKKADEFESMVIK
jgi:palmitoyltransferase